MPEATAMAGRVAGVLARLGPGMMLAAVAVGVSHLVFATQAGANYGLSLIWLVILISALKYPAFRFAVDYASATGQSLVTGYTRISRIAVCWLIVGFFVDMMFATAAVALVTAGLLISVFGLSFAAPQVAAALMVVSALVLLNGRYAKAERIVKILVLAFSVLTLVATIAAVPLLGDGGRPVFAGLEPSRGLFIFAIAVAGWMPMPTNGAVLISDWVREKLATDKKNFGRADARQDFRIGYSLTVVLAICFVVLGTAVLFGSGREVPTAAGGFATELLSVFTMSIGDWAYPLIAVAAIAVMWSTQLALMDVMPRATGRLIGALAGNPGKASSYYPWLLVLQVVGGSLIMLFLMRRFDAFLYFTTSVGFIAAPAVAWYNHKAIESDEVPHAYRPGPLIALWNRIAILAMLVFAAGFLYTSLF